LKRLWSKESEFLLLPRFYCLLLYKSLGSSAQKCPSNRKQGGFDNFENFFGRSSCCFLAFGEGLSLHSIENDDHPF